MNWTASAPARIFDWKTVKDFLKLDGDDERDAVLLMLDAATDYAAEALASSLMPVTVTATFYASEHLLLPRGPVTSITSVRDDDGDDVTYDREDHGHTVELIPTSAASYPITVIYSAGYASAAAVPASIRQAILAHVGTLYAHRESVTPLSLRDVPHSLNDFYRLRSRSRGIG